MFAQPVAICAGIQQTYRGTIQQEVHTTPKEGMKMRRSIVVALAMAGLLSMGAAASGADRMMLQEQERIQSHTMVMDQDRTMTQDRQQVRDQKRLLDGAGSGQGTAAQSREQIGRQYGSGGAGTGMQNGTGRGGGRR